MAAPAFGSVGALLSGTASTANVAVPSGVASGDIIVVAMFVDGTNTVTALPSGFQQAEGSPQSATDQTQRLYVMWKRATAADAGTYDFTLSASAFREATAVRYTGAVASGDPWDDVDAAVQNRDTATTTPAVSVTTTGADRLLVFVADYWGSQSWTPPTGFTERVDTSASGEGLLTVDDKVQASAGSSGSVSTAIGNIVFSSAAWLGALKPVASGGAEVTGAAATSVTFTATAAGVRTTTGTAATSVTFTATVSGTRTTAGTAATTAELTATAAGTVTVPGAAATTVDLTADATGTRTTFGAGATSVTFTATAVEGVQTITGTAATSITLTATAIGTPTIPGAATTSVTFTATAAGTRTVLGAAALAVAFAAAVVTVATRGTGRGTVQSTRTGRHVQTTRR